MKAHFPLSDFGQGFSQDSGITELMDDLGQAKSASEQITMLGGGNPAIIPAAEKLFREAMESILKTPGEFEKMTGYYDGPQGNMLFIHALCDYLNARFDWGLNENNIALTNGSQAGFYRLFNLFSGASHKAVGQSSEERRILLPMAP